MTHEFFPQPGDRMWTPADWAWMGGLCNIAMPALRYGVPLVAHRMGKFDPEHAFDLMVRMEVRNTFLPPTALKLMRRVARPEARKSDCVRNVERMFRNVNISSRLRGRVEWRSLLFFPLWSR